MQAAPFGGDSVVLHPESGAQRPSSRTTSPNLGLCTPTCVWCQTPGEEGEEPIRCHPRWRSSRSSVKFGTFELAQLPSAGVLHPSLEKALDSDDLRGDSWRPCFGKLFRSGRSPVAWSVRSGLFVRGVPKSATMRACGHMCGHVRMHAHSSASFTIWTIFILCQ